MRSRLISAALIVFILQAAVVCTPAYKHKTKLVTLIVVDGLGGDLLDRYSATFQHGFKRLMHEGMYFKNAWVDHAITVSHAGHVTLATGQHPSHHGIVDAAYYVPVGGTRQIVDAFADSAESVVGIEASRSVSPKNVLSTGLAEWISEVDTNAKKLAVGTGAISPVLYSFRPNADVYWYSADVGRYVTSTYYKKQYPDWINEFNDSTLTDLFYLSANWECSIPLPLRSLAYPDSTPFEERPGGSFTFPYKAADYLRGRKMDKSFLQRWIAATPTLDLATLALAKEGIRAMKLGQRNSTDYLAIVCSQLDNLSHTYGPYSLEVFDELLRLDKGLGELFDLMDQKIGENNYIVALSADHGFPEIPEQLKANGKPAERLNAESIDALMMQVDSLIGDQNVLSDSLALNVASFMRSKSFVSAAYTPAQLAFYTNTDDRFLTLYQHSWRKDRTPRLPYFSIRNFESSIGKVGVMVRLNENTMIDLDVVIHGSPYEYDRHVPILFMGGSIRSGQSDAYVKTIDVAPTLAKIAGISFPETVDGEPIIDGN